jgi:hypothetical protein
MSNAETSRMNNTVTMSKKSTGLAIFRLFRKDFP